jgi:hypothetical protein
MSNGVIIHDSADRVPEPRQPPRTAPQQPRATFDAVPLLLVGLAALGGAFVLAVPVYGAYVAWFRETAMRAGDWFFLVLLTVPAVGAALFGLACLVTAVRGLASVWRINETLTTPGGMPLTHHQLDAAGDLVAQLHIAAARADILRAERSQYGQLSTLSLSHAPVPPALPAPEPGLSLVPDTEWRRWLADAPHLLISGPSGAGKTTLATALVADASEAGASLLIVDPHDAAGKWPIAAVGGGRDYTGVYRAIDGLLAEMNARFAQLHAGETAFTPLVVLVDEAPAIALHDPKRWQQLASRLTSEARKVAIRLIVLGQSHLVRDLGLSTLVRRNLGLVALGPQAADLVSEERDAARRRQLIELIRGQSRPAAFAFKSEVHVLDVAAVPALAARAFTPRAWVPSVCLVDDVPESGDAADGQTDRRTDGQQQDAEAMREALIVGLKRAGRNREQIRQELQQLGMGLDNDEYRVILARHGLV